MQDVPAGGYARFGPHFAILLVFEMDISWIQCRFQVHLNTVSICRSLVMSRFVGCLTSMKLRCRSNNWILGSQQETTDEVFGLHKPQGTFIDSINFLISWYIFNLAAARVPYHKSGMNWWIDLKRPATDGSPTTNHPKVTQDLSYWASIDNITGWCFQTCLYFHPYLGEMIQFH